MTEAEAKMKWCPMYRCSTDHGQLSDNFTHGASGYCCASDCMAWRATDNERKPSYPGDPTAKSEPAGFCGLAGKPPC